MNLHLNKKNIGPHRLKTSFSKIGHDPRTDWLFIVTIFLVVLVIGVGVATDLFFSVRDGSASTDIIQGQTTTPSLNPVELSRIVDVYRAQTASFETLKNTPYGGPRDPSQ